jgi:N-acetylneuraminic acid mutarotase
MQTGTHLKASLSSPFTGRRGSRWFTMPALALWLFAAQSPAQIAGKSPKTQNPGVRSGTEEKGARLQNFDVRTDGDAAYMNRFAEPTSFNANAVSSRAREAGLAQLQADFKVDVVENPEIHTLEIVSTKSGFLTKPGANRVAAMRAFISNYSNAYGLMQKQVEDLVLVADYSNPAGNMAWAELEQRFHGLPVFRGTIRGGFTAAGELVRTTGQLAPGLDAAQLSASPVLTAAQAVSRAAANAGWDVPENGLVQKGSDNTRITFARGPLAEDSKAWLLYFPLRSGVARLAWAIEIWGNPNAYMILVDAEDGTVLFRKNLTNDQSQPATYSIYKDDSPAPWSPTDAIPGSGTQAPFISRTSVSLIGNEAPSTFNNLGWMTDGTNKTDGNNVEAGPDRDGTNGVDAPVTGDARVFNFSYDPQTEDPTSTNYQKGETADVFYWTNIYHDRLYLLGFTEAARNFQNDNFGRGGMAGDRISAEIQDSSGTNNANFSTPPDGSRGRMQMYVFPGSTPHRTSGIDHDVLLHELTHGLSNRLHSNGNGLTTTMAQSLGEGWSDFYARALLSTADEDPNAIYPTGAWITYLMRSDYTNNYYYGIRRFPYAVKSNAGANGKPHNPLTFADIDSSQIDTTDGAYARNPSIGDTAFEVHNAGEVWCMALLEVRARFIARLGFDTGNQRFLQYVTDGMKLDPANPTFLQGRDSILAAAKAGGGTAEDIADIWAGFAVRGMGYSAQVLNALTGMVVEAFDSPGIVTAGSTIVSDSIANGRLDPGESVTTSLCLKNGKDTASGTITGTLFATGGVVAPTGAQSYGSIPASSTACRNFTFAVGSSCGGSLTATLQAAETGRETRNLTYSFRVGSDVAFMVENLDHAIFPSLPADWSTSTLAGAANPWETSGSSADTLPLSAFVNNLALISDTALISPTIAIPAGGALLSFRNRYDTEATYDGGVLEISINGESFQDIVTAGGSFLAGGYTGTISTAYSSPISGRKAWTGDSGGFLTTTIHLPATAAAQNVRLRWRMASDNSVSSTGWYVDSIAFSGAQCGPASTPAITSISPFAAAPGTTLNATITGSDLYGATAVSFSGSGVTASIGSGGTSTSLPITISVAAGASLGNRAVTATTPAGTSPAFSSFTVGPLPAVAAISLSMGLQGTTFSTLITGTNLLGAYAVTFSGPGVTASVQSGGTDTSLPIAVTISRSASTGPRTITVKTAVGTSYAFSGFTVAALASFTSMTPNSSTAGTTVSATIAGSDLAGATAVTFSGTGVSATIQSGGTSTTLPIAISVTPGAALGLRSFTVTTTVGTSSAFYGFTVTGLPTITSISPAIGIPGTTVIIAAKDWTTASAVSFNGIPAASFEVISNSTQLIANPGFETGDFNGWTTSNQGGGSIYVLSGTTAPVTDYPLIGAHGGSYYAATDTFYATANELTQSFAVPATASKVTLSFSMFVSNWGEVSYINPAGLDYTAYPNQHARVDIIKSGAISTDTGSGVLRTFYRGVDPYANPGPYRNYLFDITDLVGGGGTFQLRFAQAINQYFQNMGVDDVSIVCESTAIQAVVPTGATSGPITVTTPAGTVSSPGNFIITGTGTSSIAISSSSNPSNSGNSVTFAATATGVSPSGIPTGTVNFLDGTSLIGTGTLNGSGQALFSTNQLTVGSHSMTAQYLGNSVYQSGTSSVLTQVVNGQAPYILSISPSGGYQGTTGSATLSGLNLLGASSVTFSGTGVTAAIVSNSSSNLLLSLSIASDATVSSRTITVTTPGGNYTTPSSLFTVLQPSPPTVYSILPGAAAPGTTTGVYVYGSSMLGASAVSFSGTGVTATIYSTAVNSVYLNVTIAANALLGVRSVTITNPYGTSAPYAGFAVLNQTAMPVTWKLRSYFNDTRTGGGAQNPVASLIGSKIYTSHGWRGEYSSKLSIYDLATNTWTHGGTTAPDAITGRYSLAGGTDLKNHYAIGGAVGSATTSSLEAFDSSTGIWSTRSSMSVARAMLGGASLGGKIYAIGGSSGASIDSPGTIYDLNEVYDPVTNAWTQLAPMPTPVTGNTAVVAYNGKIYAFGGWSASGLNKPVQIYSVESNSWTTGAPIPTPRLNANAGVLNGQIVVFGGIVPCGYDADGQPSCSTSVSISELYDPASDTWTIGPSMKTYAHFAAQGMTFNNTQIFSIPGYTSSFVQVLDAATSSQPTITSITVQSGAPGASMNAVITGTNLTGATSIVFTGTGVTATVQPGGTSTSVPVAITIAYSAAGGSRQFSVNAPTESSSLFTGFMVTGTGTSRTAITSSLNPSSWETTVLFTASVTGVWPSGTPTGTVSFLDGTTVMGSGSLNNSGQASFSTSQLTPGNHTITAQYLGDLVYEGSTSSVLNQVVVSQPPSISSIAPSAGYQGTSVVATIHGSSLLGASSVTFSGTGATATIGLGGTATSLPVTITISADAIVSPRTISVTTPYGSHTTSLVMFSVLQPGAPTIKSLFPAAGVPGSTRTVQVVGFNMFGISSVSFSGTGVTATISSTSPGRAYLNVTIAADATLGTQSMTVSNPYGTSPSFTGFTVANPTQMPVAWKTRSYFNDTRTGGGVELPSADLIGNKIYTSHGYRNTFSALLSVYDIQTNTWTHGGTTAPDASIGRYSLAGGTDLKNHYAIGGFNGSSIIPSLEAFDSSTGTWSTRSSMSVARALLGSASLGGKIYAIGGFSGDSVLGSGTIFDTNEVYNPATNTWTTLAPIPTPVAGNSATVAYNGKIYVFGGWSAAGVSNQVQIYYPAANSWTMGTPMPTPRFYANAGVLNGQIVVYGGSAPCGYDTNGMPSCYSSANITEMYDPASDTWTIGPSMQYDTFAMAQGVTFNDTQVFSIPANTNNGYVQVLDASTDPQPTITSISATSGHQGSSISAVINGTNLTGATSIVFTGIGVTARVQPGGTSTSVSVAISIARSAAISQRQFSLNTPTGSSALFTGFTVTAGKRRASQLTTY